MAKADKANDTSSVIENIASDLNKLFKSTVSQTAYVVNKDSDLTDTPFYVSDWISTGCDVLDLAISNQPHGGYPVGRITEISGLSASGKSLAAVQAIASTQKKGGVAIYYDTENAFSKSFFEAAGIDMSRMVYCALSNIEDIFEAIQNNIVSIRKNSPDLLVTIVVDSIMGATTKIEQEADFDKDGYATQKAIILSKAMRKLTQTFGRQNICIILTNQLRTRLGVSFGDPYTTSGGQAIGFHSSVRLRLKQMGKIKANINGRPTVIGIKTRAQVFKNRMGAPLKTADYDILFSSGIDNYGSWLYTMKDYKLVTTSGAWHTYTHVDKETGEVLGSIKFQSKDFEKKLEENPEIKQAIYDDICNVLINTYEQLEDIGIDDMKLDTNFDIDSDIIPTVPKNSTKLEDFESDISGEV